MRSRIKRVYYSQLPLKFSSEIVHCLQAGVYLNAVRLKELGTLVHNRYASAFIQTSDLDCLNFAREVSWSILDLFRHLSYFAGFLHINYFSRLFTITQFEDKFIDTCCDCAFNTC